MLIIIGSELSYQGSNHEAVNISHSVNISSKYMTSSINFPAIGK